MRTVLYHKQFPWGEVYDTDKGMPDPHVSTAPNGWVDSPAKLRVTTDDVVEAAVKAELKKQGDDRNKLDKEFKKKTGDAPNYAMKSETLIKVLDDK
jgi:hypothetical protein